MDHARTPLAGLVIVLTGAFKLTHAVLSDATRVQGHVRLDEGKGAVAEAITSRGGTVRGSVSKWTHVLVVGDQPGSTKVLAARGSQSGTVLLLARPFLDALQSGRVHDAIEAAKNDPPLEIGEFSLGWSRGGGAVVAPPLAPPAYGGSGSAAVVRTSVRPAALAADNGAGVVAEPCTVCAAPAGLLIDGRACCGAPTCRQPPGGGSAGSSREPPRKQQQAADPASGGRGWRARIAGYDAKRRPRSARRSSRHGNM